MKWFERGQPLAAGRPRSGAHSAAANTRGTTSKGQARSMLLALGVDGERDALGGDVDLGGPLARAQVLEGEAGGLDELLVAGRAWPSGCDQLVVAARLVAAQGVADRRRPAQGRPPCRPGPPAWPEAWSPGSPAQARARWVIGQRTASGFGGGTRADGWVKESSAAASERLVGAAGHEPAPPGHRPPP